jgi:drug/metabolite transporter (DMT)-like permease
MSPRDAGQLLMLAALWGGSFAFMRVAVPALGPLWLAESRVSLAFATLLAVALARKSVPRLRERWRDFLFIGTLNSALPFALFCFAEQTITASSAAILNATSPIFAAVAAAIWLREALTLRALAGMALGLAGVVLLVGWQAEPLASKHVLAIAACLAAAICYAIASIYVKLRATGLPSFSIALYSQLAAAIVLAPSLPFSPPTGPLTSIVVGTVLALAVASTAIAYLLYFRLIAAIGPARALTVTFLIPLFGIAWGHLFLGEPLTAHAVAGCSLVLAGTWIATRPAARRA